MRLAATLATLVLLALIVSVFVPAPGASPGNQADTNLPWQIEADGRGGSTVFGLKPGVSTLGDMRRRLGGDFDMAIVAAPGEVGTLEAYYDQIPLGFVQARLIATVDLPPATVAAMRERAVKAELMESTTKKISLSPDDRAMAERAPIRAITVIPSVNLDAAAIVQRFGEPEARIAVSPQRTHLLYPKKGLDVLVDSEGKELLQYVAPRDFDRLRAPLRPAG